MSLTFLYEDNHVLAVDKPAGMLAQGDLSGDLDLLSAAKQVIKRRDSKPGNVFLGLVHRLDRPVSGVMVLAKTSKAASRLSAQLRERAATKTYLAVVSGRPERDTAELCHYLRRDPAQRSTRVVGEGDGGKRAVLRYQVLETRGSRSLLEIDLVTGLSHQIRAQLSAVGLPVVGDRKYGSSARFLRGKIALHARSMSFSHPVRSETVAISADPPAHWPW